ncbi:hypothetical protein M8C21_006977, partial [Ambrosia artemisiifolia]
QHTEQQVRPVFSINLPSSISRKEGRKGMEAASSKLPLPDAFLQFLNDNGIDPSIYTASHFLPRYVRLRPGCEEQVEEIEADIGCKLEKVEWLPNFYSLPPQIQIAGSISYQEGKIYGIDAASGAAVSALNISTGDHVLDLCAAPVNRESGMKGDEFLYNEWTSRKPYKERKKAIKEREKGSLRLNQDPELIYYGRHSGVVGLSKTELFKSVSSHEISQYGYDKVLVDAECTHDGSIKHIQKFENWGWTTLERRVLDAERTDDLAVLQFRLLTNGFKLLKVGGYLVYSTCSLTYAQNEDIVEKFLSLNPCAELLDIDGSKCWPCKSGRIPKTLRSNEHASMALDEIRGRPDVFSYGAVWEGQELNFERVAWLKVMGIPLDLLDDSVLGNIGSFFGSVVKKPVLDWLETDSSFQYVGVVVNHGARIKDVLFLKWRGRSIKIWVEEVEKEWLSDFVDEAPQDSGGNNMETEEDGGPVEEAVPEPEVKPGLERAENMEGVNAVSNSPINEEEKLVEENLKIDSVVDPGSSVLLDDESEEMIPQPAQEKSDGDNEAVQAEVSKEQEKAATIDFGNRLGVDLQNFECLVSKTLEEE